jgi:ADP-heptose:LPS heptosyltransferase
LDVLASPANAAILEAADYVHDVIVFDKKRLAGYWRTVRRLRRAHYDAVIDCMVTAPSLTTLLLILASGARHRIGIAGRGNDTAFTITVPPETRDDAHMVDHLAALVAAFGVDPKSADVHPILGLTNAERARAARWWEFEPDEPGGGSRVLVNVSAGTSARVWDEEKYVAIMRHVRELDPSARFRVIGAPSEWDRAERIARDGGGMMVRTPSIRDAFALVASADFVYTPDTSIAHAAAAFNRPCVAMYATGAVTRWGLYGAPPGRSIEHSEETLRTLSAERMIRAVDEAWPAAVSQRG